jgi:hypothetical protein
VSLPAHPQVPEFGPLDVEKIPANSPVEFDIDVHGADEICVFQRGLHVLQMPRQPQIVVGLVANDPPARLAKHAIAMNFTVTRPFRKIEKPDAGVGRLQTLDSGTNRIIDTVSDDEDFDVVNALRLHTRHCERQDCSTVTMGRNKNANSGHRVQQIVLRASAGPAVSATRGYARPLGTPGHLDIERGAASWTQSMRLNGRSTIAAARSKAAED